MSLADSSSVRIYNFYSNVNSIQLATFGVRIYNFCSNANG